MTRSVSARTFPVVCVGGSAGGLDAYIRFLDHFPPDTGAALVFVNHLRATTTLLHEILPAHTKMPVALIRNELKLRVNHVYIIPPQRDLHVWKGDFRLEPISKPRGWPDTITVFLKSLAENWDGRLFAVIVSGYDGDGADALEAIHHAGGVIIAQQPDTASQPDMPESAIASGWVDFILPPEQIGVRISSLISPRHARGWGAVKTHV